MKKVWNLVQWNINVTGRYLEFKKIAEISVNQKANYPCIHVRWTSLLSFIEGVNSNSLKNEEKKGTEWLTNRDKTVVPRITVRLIIKVVQIFPFLGLLRVGLLCVQFYKVQVDDMTSFSPIYRMSIPIVILYMHHK